MERSIHEKAFTFCAWVCICDSPSLFSVYFLNIQVFQTSTLKRTSAYVEDKNVGRNFYTFLLCSLLFDNFVVVYDYYDDCSASLYGYIPSSLVPLDFFTQTLFSGPSCLMFRTMQIVLVSVIRSQRGIFWLVVLDFLMRQLNVTCYTFSLQLPWVYDFRVFFCFLFVCLSYLSFSLSCILLFSLFLFHFFFLEIFLLKFIY